MRIFGRRGSFNRVTAGTDQVVAEYPLPSGGKLNNVDLEVHVIGIEETSIRTLNAYGLTGFVVPVVDPDAATSVQTIWDTLIPKDLDAGSGVFDLDTLAVDTTPEYELGELDLSAVFELVGLKPREIFRRRKRISVASNSTGFENQAAATDDFTPVDFFTTKVRGNVSVQRPSMVLFGVSSPDMTQTTATVPTAPSETQWMLLQYLEQAVENMLMFVAGLIETGAETPYEESSAFVAQLLEATLFEEVATGFNPQSWDVFTFATFDISVPGRMQLGTISSE